MLEGYADADYASDAASRLSHSGIVFKSAGAAVHWSSSKQTGITLSSTEAELVALCQAVRDAIGLRNLMSDLGSPDTEPTVIYEDNTAAQAIASDDFQISKKTKHIDVQYGFVGQEQRKGTVKVADIATGDQQADLFTKGLGNIKHHELTRLVTGH